MINVNDFKTGVTIVVDENIYQVFEFLHVKPGNTELQTQQCTESKEETKRTSKNKKNTPDQLD